MTIQPKQHTSPPEASAHWSLEATETFTFLCQKEGLNPVRFRKLVDNYALTKRKPSRQELINTLKHRPKIQERPVILRSITNNLNSFIKTFIDNIVA
ncbi:MAG: hypothetical protein ABWX90_01555 [Candidatus Saccharimonadales bacterium]